MHAVLRWNVMLVVLGVWPGMVLAVDEVELSNASGDNDTIATAEALGALGAAPLVVNGFISTTDDDDIDFYSFTGSANQFVGLGISRGDDRPGSTDDVDTQLALFLAGRDAHCRKR